MEINKKKMYEITDLLIENNRDRTDVLEASEQLLKTNINEEQTIQFIINALYNNYIEEVALYTEVFTKLGIIKPPVQATEEVVDEELPKKTKKEIETEEKEEELKVNIEENEKSLEDEVEDYDKNSFKNKMKEDTGLSVLERVKNLKKWFMYD